MRMMIIKSYSFTEFTGNAALLTSRITSKCMFSTKPRAQGAFLEWIIDLHRIRKPWDCGPTQSILDNGCRITLTVTCVSKKYLSVNIKPRTISVRNKVLILWLKTALFQEKKSHPLSPKVCLQRSQNVTNKPLPEFQSFDISLASCSLSSSSAVFFNWNVWTNHKHQQLWKVKLYTSSKDEISCAGIRLSVMRMSNVLSQCYFKQHIKTCIKLLTDTSLSLHMCIFLSWFSWHLETLIVIIPWTLGRTNVHNCSSQNP